MQLFIAQLSNQIDKSAFEKSWQSESGLSSDFKVDFVFDCQKVSINIESKGPGRWQSDNFQRTFSKAIRRVDQSCNVRWI